MKLKILVGTLIVLIVINLATIGTFLYMQFKRPPHTQAFMAPEAASRDAMRGGRPWLRRLPRRERGELIAQLLKFQSETQEFRARIHVLENQAFDLMQRDPVPTARVDSLLGEIAAARLEVSRVAIRKLVESKKVLRPEEQRMFFDAILQARPGPRGGHGPRGAGESPRAGEGLRGGEGPSHGERSYGEPAGGDSLPPGQ